MSRKKCTSIGGQAVIEGVMMRGVRSMATAVRDESGAIVVESKYVKPVKEKNFLFRTPFLRGIFNFFATMITGMGTLIRSGEVFDGESEPGKTERWFAKKLGVNVYNLVIGIAVLLGIALSIGLFFFLPQALTSLIVRYGHIDTASVGMKIGVNFLEGAVRMLIFVGYIALTALMKDVRRTYMYHGAEHKTISCYEHDLPLTVENARTMTTVHDRCGTTFMFIIMVVSVLVFSVLGWSSNMWVRFGLRLALLPVVSGVSYEVLKLLARFDNAFVRILKAPGLWLQKLTTRQPTDDMLEVAIAAFTTVMAMDADPDLPEQRFNTKKSYAKVRRQVEELLAPANVEPSDVDWIFCEATGVKRGALAELTHIRENEAEQALAFAARRAEGVPLWRVFGHANFYGLDLIVDGSVLCPRPETEYLAEYVVERCAERAEGVRVLDLCTGSGCIALAVAANAPNASVTAADVSEEALVTARANAQRTQLTERVEFVRSDMFGEITGLFDIIVANPPYIPTAEIADLAREVKDSDPTIALDGGADGLDFYRVLGAEAPRFLFAGGVLAVECGADQAAAVKALMTEFDCEIRKDLEGNERIVAGVKRGDECSNG